MKTATSLKQPDHPANVFVGRQPIFDRDGDIHAYELLFREGSTNAAGVIDGTQASARVLHNTLMEFGLDAIAGGKLCLINFNRELLLSSVPTILPAGKVVLEILEDVEIDEQLIDCITGLKHKGFTLALDDFEYQPQWQPLIELADIVKLDVMALSSTQIQEHLELLRPYKLKLLAEKVETEDEHEALMNAGFDFFQGFYYARPAVISGKQLASNELTLLELIAKLNNPESEIEDIEKLVEQDAGLSYKLLRFINSAAFSLPEKITSLRRAIIFFGIGQLRNWASLIAMADVNKHSNELLRTASVRAKFCESLGAASHDDHAESFFIVGLFSVLDALLDQPMDAITEHLPLDEDIKAALNHREGAAGTALSCALACERCALEDVHFAGIDATDLYALYLESMLWAEHAMG